MAQTTNDELDGQDTAGTESVTETEGSKGGQQATTGGTTGPKGSGDTRTGKLRVDP